jgi:hypothetical protein
MYGTECFDKLTRAELYAVHDVANASSGQACIQSVLLSASRQKPSTEPVSTHS